MLTFPGSDTPSFGAARYRSDLSNGSRLGGRHAAAYASWRTADYARRVLRPARGIDRVLVSNVGGVRVQRALTLAARTQGIGVGFVSVPRRGGGISIGYVEPWRLGVDRFVAMLAAHQLYPRVPLCVVGVGTAMTIDVVGADGRHRGGLIIPAPELMVQTLLHNTQGIRRRAQGGAKDRSSLLGRSTRAAIVEGARSAAAALIDRTVESARAFFGRKPLVVLTGGEASAVRSRLRSRSVEVNDLVLRGLAILAITAPESRG